MIKNKKIIIAPCNIANMVNYRENLKTQIRGGNSDKRRKIKKDVENKQNPQE